MDGCALQISKRNARTPPRAALTGLKHETLHESLLRLPEVAAETASISRGDMHEVTSSRVPLAMNSLGGSHVRILAETMLHSAP
jgi:hypothetical protein